MKTISAIRLLGMPTVPTFFSSLMNFFSVYLHLLIKMGVAMRAIFSLISLIFLWASDIACLRGDVNAGSACASTWGEYRHSSNMLLKQ